MVYVPGPYDAEHLYVQWGGKLPGGEQWSCGLRMAKIGPGDLNSGAGLLVGVGAALVKYHTHQDTAISQAAKLSFVKVNAIGLDGRYLGNETNEATYADVPGAWANLPRHPNQVTWAVSLLTGFSRGAAHRGRFFLPLPMADMTADGRVSTTYQTALKNQSNILLADLNAVDPNYEVAVFSRKMLAATHRKVTECAVGRVLDTQRRRRASLMEDY